MNLNSLLEYLTDSNPKRLLVLVHPDCVFEMTETHFIEAYLDRLSSSLDDFDYVITHLMFSKVAPEVVSGIKTRLDLWNDFMAVLNSKSDWIGLDKKFSASFNDALPDFLIDNPGTEIYFAGGYQNLCIPDTKKALLSQLKDILRDTDASIKKEDFLPLVIKDKHKPAFGDT